MSELEMGSLRTRLRDLDRADLKTRLQDDLDPDDLIPKIVFTLWGIAIASICGLLAGFLFQGVSLILIRLTIVGYLIWFIYCAFGRAIEKIWAWAIVIKKKPASIE